MSDAKKDSEKKEKIMRSPIEWLFRSALLILGSVIALNLAICYLRPILPWVIGTIAVIIIAWIVMTYLRWRRNRW